MNNPIIEEIREARAALAAEHGYDLIRINDWARQQTLARKTQNKRKVKKSEQAAPRNLSGKLEIDSGATVL
jgi:hypothetical protein